jgi:hypothetical protein
LVENPIARSGPAGYDFQMKLAIPIRLGLFALVAAALLIVSCTPDQAKQAELKPSLSLRMRPHAEIPYDRPLTAVGSWRASGEARRSPEEPLLYYYIDSPDPATSTAGYSGVIISVKVVIGQRRSGK